MSSSPLPVFDEVDDIGNVDSEDVSFLMRKAGLMIQVFVCDGTRVSLVLPGDFEWSTEESRQIKIMKIA